MTSPEVGTRAPLPQLRGKLLGYAAACRTAQFLTQNHNSLSMFTRDTNLYNIKSSSHKRRSTPPSRASPDEGPPRIWHSVAWSWCVRESCREALTWIYPRPRRSVSVESLSLGK